MARWFAKETRYSAQNAPYSACEKRDLPRFGNLSASACGLGEHRVRLVE